MLVWRDSALLRAGGRRGRGEAQARAEAGESDRVPVAGRGVCTRERFVLFGVVEKKPGAAVLPPLSVPAAVHAGGEGLPGSTPSPAPALSSFWWQPADGRGVAALSGFPLCPPVA